MIIHKIQKKNKSLYMTLNIQSQIHPRLLNYKYNEKSLLYKKDDKEFIKHKINDMDIIRLDMNIFQLSDDIHPKCNQDIWIKEVSLVEYLQSIFSPEFLDKFIEFMNSNILLYPIILCSPEKNIYYNKIIIQKIIHYYCIQNIDIG